MTFYRLWLRLLPASFRAEYGDELTEVFAERLAHTHGFAALAVLWIGELLDVLVTALRMHADIMRQDLRYTTRSLRRAPGFTFTAVVVAALGVGATTAAFSMADHVLVRPLPFADSPRLVRVWQDQTTRGYSRIEASPPNYKDWVRMSASFSSLAAYTGIARNLMGPSGPARVDGIAATANLFDTLAVPARLGRTFTSADAQPGAAPTVVLSDALWREQFGSDPGVLGKAVTLSDTPYVVLGVMPGGFFFPSREADFWVVERFESESDLDRTNLYLRTVARLKPGVSLEQASAELRVIGRRLEQAYPDANAHTGARVVSLRDDVTSQTRLLLLALAGASVCMLLIACTNVANLLLSRALGRRHEVAVRTALGAGRERLVRQLLTEGLVLALAGGALGVLLAVAMMPVVTHLVPTGLPIDDTPSLDVRVLALAASVTVITGLAFALLPALRISRADAANGLREGVRGGTARGTERIRSVLVVAEIVASVVLLVAAGLLVRALWKVQTVDPGFRKEGVLTMRTELPLPKYEPTARRVQFYRSVVDEVEALPGVTSAAYISFLPMVMRGGIWPVSPDAAALAPDENRMASLRFVTPRYFDTVGTPLRMGRDVAATDTFEQPRVAVVSESFVKASWPGERNPLGKRFFMAFDEREVVGVVADIRVRGLERESEPQVYLPAPQVRDGSLVFYTPKDLVVRTTGSPAALVPAIRDIVARADAQQPVSNIRLLERIVAADTAPRTAQVQVLTGFAVTAALLAAVGIHGLLSFSVSQRLREIAVRMALGASRGDILRLIAGHALALGVTGAVVGLLCAYPLAVAMRALLAGVSPADFVTLGAVAALVLVVTLVGALLPARRAVNVQPMAAMRAE